MSGARERRFQRRADERAQRTGPRRLNIPGLVAELTVPPPKRPGCPIDPACPVDHLKRKKAAR